jgi:hypothetical protein
VAPAPSPAQSAVVTETINQQVNLVTTFLTLLAKEDTQQTQQLVQSLTDPKSTVKKAGIEVAADEQSCK